MSHKGNDAYLEELSQAEEEYQDALLSLKNADKEMKDAYDWKRKMEQNADQRAKELQTLKDKNK